MYELDLPLIDQNELLERAVKTLRQSNRSALVVVQQDGAHLYRADVLEWQMPDRASKPIKEAAGALWIPFEGQTQQMSDRAGTGVGPSAVFKGQREGRALVGFVFEATYLRSMSATTRYYCNLDPANHNYSPADVKQLAKLPGGVGWKCGYSDGGIVT